MRVLVTGGAGYIGSHTVRELKNQGYEVTALDTLERGASQAVLGVPLLQADITDAVQLEQAFQQVHPEAVIHFAAYKAPGESMAEPTRYFRNNVYGTLQLLDTMVRHTTRYMIFSSSCSIFGTPQVLPVTEETPFGPESVYGESKLMGETLLKWFDRTCGLKSVALRYFNASGASLDNAIGEDWDTTYNLIPLVMKAILGRAPAIKVFGNDYPTRDGTAIRDYIHVVDLAIAHVKALEYLISGEESTAFNLGSGVGHSVQEVIDTARRVSGKDLRVEYVERRAGDPVAIWADSSKAERELDWKAQYNLETIVRTAWIWHSTHPNGLKEPQEI
ncbi:MAG TPA: UDP-glucose 4-epimerase GalE [Ktedonobacteraceae bacterium]|nr:UDP-glucose 4-epimerase GalE [Ktedonobacteraceae bacterium]